MEDQLARLRDGRLEGIHVNAAGTLTLDCLLADDRPFALALGPVVHFVADSLRAENVVKVAALVVPSELGPDVLRRLGVDDVAALAKEVLSPKALVIECTSGCKVYAIVSWTPGALAIEAPEKRYSLPPQA